MYCPEGEFIRANVCLSSCLANEVVSDDGFFCDCDDGYLYDDVTDL